MNGLELSNTILNQYYCTTIGYVWSLDDQSYL